MGTLQSHVRTLTSETVTHKIYLLTILCSLSLAESTTLADFLYQRLSKFRVGGERNIFHKEHDENKPRTSLTAAGASPVRVLVYPDQHNHEEAVEQDLTEDDSDVNNKKSPMTLQNVQESSVHFSTEPQSYVPKVQQNNTAVQYEPSDSSSTFNLNNFLREKAPKIEDLYIVQLAKNILEFKRAKFEEFKDFIEFKAHRWENIISSKKSKIEKFFANTDLSDMFDINNVRQFKDAKIEDLVELIKLKKLKIEELVALNQLLELKQSKIQEFKNLLDYKKSKLQELSNNVIAQYKDHLNDLPEVIQPEYIKDVSPTQTYQGVDNHPRNKGKGIRAERESTPINVAVHASKVFGTQEFFEDFRKARGQPPTTSYSENSAPVSDPSPQPTSSLPTSPSLPPPSVPPSPPTLIRYTAVPTPSEPISSNVFTAGGARINREIQPEDMVIVKINSEANDGEVTMLKQVSLEEQDNDLEDYIEDVFQERLDTLTSDTVAQFGQEWDVMEEYIDLNVAPTSVHVVDTNMMVTNDLPSEDRGEDIIYDDSGLVSTGQERFGQQWDVMEDYVDADPMSEFDGEESYQVYSQDDYVPVDENQILSLDAEISSQEENPYYNHQNPMVHEHLIQDYDYSGYIPTINAEYVNYGNNYEDNIGYEPSSLPIISNNLDLNHLDKDDTQHQDTQSRKQLSDILSEDIPGETSTRPSASESKEKDIETVTNASVSTLEENEEAEETTTVLSSTTPDTTTATDEPSTHLPEIAPEGVLISEDLTLPPGLEALNLVTEKIEAPSEKALHLPDAEPLVSKNVEDEFFVLPAGHGLRFKFKIRDLDYYNPVFGFQSK